MNPALGAAALSAGVSLVGGLFGRSSAKKAADKQHRYNLEYMTRTRDIQAFLADKQNAMTHDVNNRIGAHNNEVLANHSTETRSETTSVNQRSTGGIDFAAMLRDAESAGFNPMTVLRNGGMAGYATSNTVTDTKFDSTYKPIRELMTYVAPGEIPQFSSLPSAPQVAAVNPVGDALNAGLAAYQQYDPLAGQRAALEMGLARAQIDNYKSDTAANYFRMKTPTWTAPTVRTSSGGFGGFQRGAGNGAPNGLGAYNPEANRSTVTNPWANGSVESGLPDASAIEDRYGEPAAWVYAPVVSGIDMVKNLVHSRPFNDGVDYLKDTYASLTASWGRSNSNPAASAPAP